MHPYNTKSANAHNFHGMSKKETQRSALPSRGNLRNNLHNIEPTEAQVFLKTQY